MTAVEKKDELAAKYFEMIEPIQRKYNERMARTIRPDEMAKIHREYMAAIKPITDWHVRVMCMIAPDPIIIRKEQADGLALPHING